MNFKKGKFVDPTNGFKQGQFKDHGSINPAPSKVTQFFRQVKNNPGAPYTFLKQVGIGLSFAPIANIGKIGAAGINLFKSKLGVNVGKTIGTKITGKSSTQIINNKVNNNINNLVKDVLPMNMKEYRVGGKLYGHITKDGKLTNKFLKDVPVVGTNKTTKVPINSSTTSVSYVNPKISMTPAERLKAGY